MFPPVYNVVHENVCIAFLQFWISWQRKYLTSLVRKVFVHKALTQFQCHPEVFLLFVTAILEASSLAFGKQPKVGSRSPKYEHGQWCVNSFVCGV